MCSHGVKVSRGGNMSNITSTQREDAASGNSASLWELHVSSEQLIVAAQTSRPWRDWRSARLSRAQMWCSDGLRGQRLHQQLPWRQHCSLLWPQCYPAESHRGRRGCISRPGVLSEPGVSVEAAALIPGNASDQGFNLDLGKALLTASCRPDCCVDNTGDGWVLPEAGGEAAISHSAAFFSFSGCYE